MWLQIFKLILGDVKLKVHFKPSMWLSFFAVPAFIILCILGSWQMQRSGWKSNLIEEYNTKFNKAPLNLNENFKNLSGNRFRRVIVNGIFDHNKEINIIGKTYEGNAGFHINGRSIIFLNRLQK